MEICGTENGFDYYSAQVTIGADIFVLFEIQYGWVTCITIIRSLYET